MTAPMKTKADAAIQVKTLRKSFGQQRVLNGIDLEVAKGETLSVLGRSGTGKPFFKNNGGRGSSPPDRRPEK